MSKTNKTPQGRTFVFAVALVVMSTLAIAQDITPAAKSGPIPAFTLPQLADGQKTFTPASLKGQVWLLNAWASWCGACRKEHPVLLDLSRQNVLPIVGFNYQDQRDAGLQWLNQHGNPYMVTAFDGEGQVGVDLVLVGLPATFVVDKQGRVRFRFSGPVTPELLKNKLLPLIQELKRG